MLALFFFVFGLLVAFFGLNSILAKSLGKTTTQLSREHADKSRSVEHEAVSRVIDQLIDAVNMPEILFVGGLIIAGIGMLGFYLNGVKARLDRQGGRSLG